MKKLSRVTIFNLAILIAAVSYMIYEHGFLNGILNLLFIVIAVIIVKVIESYLKYLDHKNK